MEINISKYIDYTLLKADATAEMFEMLCNEAMKYSFYAVCVPPYAVKQCKDLLKGTQIKVVTVIGFPLGYNSTETKVYEIVNAVAAGADEIDVVINISAFKSEKFDYTAKELAELRKSAGKNTLKIIIETAYLNREEIVKVCGLVSESGADFIKTSTGFASSGAKIEDIELIKKTVPGLAIKASGGIKTYKQACAFLQAGASRIGTSSTLRGTEEIQSGTNK